MWVGELAGSEGHRARPFETDKRAIRGLALRWAAGASAAALSEGASEAVVCGGRCTRTLTAPQPKDAGDGGRGARSAAPSYRRHGRAGVATTLHDAGGPRERAGGVVSGAVAVRAQREGPGAGRSTGWSGRQGSTARALAPFNHRPCGALYRRQGRHILWASGASPGDAAGRMARSEWLGAGRRWRRGAGGTGSRRRAGRVRRR